MTTYALIHGFGHDSFTWHALIPELEKRGHTAVTIDLPTSDPTATLDSNINLAANTFADVTGPVLIVAHSMGGAVGLGLAERLDVEGIVLLNSAIFLSSEIAPEQPEPMLTVDWSLVTPDEKGFVHMPEDFCRRFFYADVPEKLMPEVLAHIHAQTLSANGGPSSMPRPNVPAVYVHAEEDQVVNRAWAQWAAEAITGRSMRTIPGSHSSFYSRPAELAALLDDIAVDFAAESARL